MAKGKAFVRVAGERSPLNFSEPHLQVMAEHLRHEPVGHRQVIVSLYNVPDLRRPPYRQILLLHGLSCLDNIAYFFLPPRHFFVHGIQEVSARAIGLEYSVHAYLRDSELDGDRSMVEVFFSCRFGNLYAGLGRELLSPPGLSAVGELHVLKGARPFSVVGPLCLPAVRALE